MLLDNVSQNNSPSASFRYLNRDVQSELNLHIPHCLAEWSVGIPPPPPVTLIFYRTPFK